MARNRARTNLPTPTPEQIRDERDRLRRTPSGGWAWKCHYCGRYASSETNAGKYVCYAHGGERAAQRDPVKRQKMRDAGRKPPKPQGRPIETGWYSKGETIRVQDLVEEYQAKAHDPDDTDKDMLHLRARIENMLAMEPLVTDVVTEIGDALEELRAWRRERVDDAGGATVETVVARLDQMDELRRTTEALRKALARYLGFQEQIEFRHREVIKAAKIRAETRLKDRAARELTVFGAFLQRFLIALQEQMPPDAFLALSKRLEKDLDTVPRRMIELPGKRDEELN